MVMTLSPIAEELIAAIEAAKERLYLRRLLCGTSCMKAWMCTVTVRVQFI